MSNIAKWNGTSWNALGEGVNSDPNNAWINLLQVYEDTLFVGGNFDKNGSTTLNNIAKSDGTNMHNIGIGTDNTIHCMEVYDNKLYVGGDFSTLDNLSADKLAAYEKSGVSVELFNQNNISKTNIHPNPTISSFTVKDPNISKTNIYDQLGNKI